MTIKDVIKNSPAGKNGIEAGDRLLEVNSQIITGTDREDAIRNASKLLNGDEGTTVLLKLFRERKGEFNLTLTREPLYKREFALIYFMRGNYHHEYKQYKEAVDDYSQSLRFEPNGNVAYLNRGLSRAELGDTEGAISDYSQAIAIYSKYGEAYLQRGLARRTQSDKSFAIKDLKQAASLCREQAKVDCSKEAEAELKRL